MPRGFDNSIINQVQQASDIVDVISEHVNLVSKGREMVGLCPFHEDHKPSMYVNNVKQIFKCFACGAGGDVFKFVQMRENLTFPQAIERLAQRAGIEIKKTSHHSSASNVNQINPNVLAKVNAWAAKYFQANLYDDKKGKLARDYIAERKITQESIKTWRIGLAVGTHDDLIQAAKIKGISEKLLSSAGLIVNRKGGGFCDKFVARLMFPITDITGRIIGFGGRTLVGADAKYINSPTTILFDKSNSIYGLEQARHKIVSSQTAIVVEGYTDCIMPHQFGCTNVVATLGTSFTPGHARILRRYAKKIVLIFDSDIAGTKASNRAIDVCLSQHIDIKIASVPEGKDPCDFVLNAGKEKFEDLADNAIDVLQFKWDKLAKSFDDANTFVDNKAAIEEFLQTIATAMQNGRLTAIDKGLIVNRLSKIIGLESDEINRDLNNRLARIVRNASYQNAAQNKNPKFKIPDSGDGAYAIAQREILEVLLNEPELFDTIEKEITVDVFDTPILKQLAEILFKILRKEQKVSPLRAILTETESVEFSAYVVELAEAGEVKGNFKNRLTGAVNAIQRYKAQIRKTDIKEMDDQKQFLRRICENTGKENPHSLGMV
ncbi:MAG: DNA primase [Planctomycetes bacterium]|nr:DNA primase [Planctomycetota bacterium]MCK5472591.1 DNA primase [Planctomycetota bacterium]